MTAPRAGVDVVSVERIRTALLRTPGLRDRLFTTHEIADATRDGVTPRSEVAVRRLAARFAAKEAARKCLGGPLRWRDVEIRTAPDGAPSLRVRGVPSSAAVSLSHDGDVAIAFVVSLDAPEPEVA